MIRLSSTFASNRESDAAKALSLCADWLSKRALTKLQIQLKLKQRGFTLETIEEALSRAEALHWIDETASAEIIFNHSLRLGEGPNLAIQRCRQKGIPAEQVYKALVKVSPELWVLSAQKACKKRAFKLKLNGDAVKLKLNQYLRQKGFAEPVLSEAIRNYIASVSKTLPVLNN